MKTGMAIITFLTIIPLSFAQTKKDLDTIKVEIPESTAPIYENSLHYQAALEVGYGWGLGTYGMDNLKINLINSLYFTPYFSTGIGIGIRKKYEKTAFYDTYKWPRIAGELYPIFLDLRTNFTTQKASPYLALGLGGYLGVYGLWAGTKGGFFLNPTAGVRYKISKRMTLIVAIDYEMLDMEFFDERTSTYPRENVSSLGVLLGFIFLN